MATLIILLPSGIVTPETEYDFLLTEDGQGVSQAGRAAARNFPTIGRTNPVLVAIAPAAALSWHRVELPAGITPAAARMKEVLDGLLEDHLLDEPALLHFALAPDFRAGETQWIAACDRRWLAIAVQTLEGEKRPVARVVPEWGPPGSDLFLHVTGTAEHPHLAVCGPDSANVFPFTEGAVALMQASGELDDSTRLSAEPELVEQAQVLFGRRVKPWSKSRRWRAAARSPWDLSKRLRMRKRANRSKIEWLRAPRWRAARWGLVLLIAGNLIGLNAWAWHERTQVIAKREAVRESLTRTFPEVKAVVDGPAQMERALRLLEQARAIPAATDLDALLGAAARAVPPGSEPQSIDYDGTALRLHVPSLLPPESNNAVDRLREQGYTGRLDGDTLVLQPDAAQARGVR